MAWRHGVRLLLTGLCVTACVEAPAQHQLSNGSAADDDADEDDSSDEDDEDDEDDSKAEEPSDEPDGVIVTPGNPEPADEPEPSNTDVPDPSQPANPDGPSNPTPLNPNTPTNPASPEPTPDEPSTSCSADPNTPVVPEPAPEPTPAPEPEPAPAPEPEPAPNTSNVEVLVSEAEYIGDFELDGEQIYYVAGQTLKSVPLSGGTGSVLATSPSPVRDIAVSYEYVVFVAEPDQTSSRRELVSLPKLGSQDALLTVHQGEPAENFVATIGSMAYWIAQTSSDDGLQLYRVYPGGDLPAETRGSVSTLDSFGPGIVSTDYNYGELLFESVYSPNSWIIRWDADTGDMQDLHETGVSNLTSVLSADESYIYWNEGLTLNRTERGQSTVSANVYEPLLTFPAGVLHSLFNDADYFYFASDNAAMKIPKTGGQATVLANAVTDYYGVIRIDENYVYSVRPVGEGSEIVRFPK